MLRPITIFFFFSLLLLEGCQQKLNRERNERAAAYNTALGLAYLKQGDRSRAKQKMLKALEMAPRSAEVNASMAFYFENTADLKEAEHFYKNALVLAPKNGSQLNNYGSFLRRQGKYKEAEGYFLNAVKDVQYLHTAQAYENAGLCALGLLDYPKAKYYFSKALEQDPQRKKSLYELEKIELRARSLDPANKI